MEDKWSDINIIGIGIGGWNGRGRAAGQKDLLERAGGLLTARQICIPTHTHTHTERHSGSAISQPCPFTSLIVIIVCDNHVLISSTPTVNAICT